jgi:hypothetical protein
MMECWNGELSGLIWYDFINFLPNIPLFQNSSIPCTNTVEGLRDNNNLSNFVIRLIYLLILIFF